MYLVKPGGLFQAQVQLAHRSDDETFFLQPGNDFARFTRRHGVGFDYR